MADEIQTLDQFLIEQQPNKKEGRSLPVTAAKLVRNGSMALLALQHLFVAVDQVGKNTPLDEQVKFSGLQIYARAQEWELSTKLIDHFLGGNGKTLDVTKEFANVIREAVVGKDDRVPIDNMNDKMSNEELMSKLVQNVFARVARGSDKEDFAVFARTLSPDGKEIYHSRDDLPGLIGQEVRLFRVVSLATEDSFYGLGKFTLSVKGELVGTKEGELEFKEPTIEIYDRYDWRRGMDLNAETTIGNMIEGTALENIFPESIKDISLSVDDDDGATLVEHNIAKPFDVTATYQIGGTLSIPTTNIALPKK